MIHDRFVYCLSQPFHIQDCFVKLQHRVQIIHRGFWRIQLIIHHIKLLRCQRVSLFHLEAIFFFRVYIMNIFIVLLIQSGNFLRGMSSENIGCRNAPKSALYNHFHSAQRVSAQLVEIIMNTSSLKMQDLFKCFTQCFLNFITRGGIIILIHRKIGRWQFLAAQLSCGSQRILIDMDKERRKHIIWQIFLHCFTGFFKVHFDMICIICTYKNTISIIKNLYCCRIDIQNPLCDIFNFSRFYPVSIDFYHIIQTATDNQITFFIQFSQVASMINSIDKCFPGFLG